MDKALPRDIERLTAGIVHNFIEEVGCKNAYHDMVRYLYVPFERAQTGLPDSELNRLTRQAIDEQKSVTTTRRNHTGNISIASITKNNNH